MSNLPYFKLNNGGEFVLNREGNFIVGSQQADFVLTGQDVSPGHATVIRVRDRVMIKPEQGEVQVNGTSVTRPVPLQDGDVVTVGSISFKFIVPKTGIYPATSVPTTTPSSRTTSGLPPSLSRKPATGFDLDEPLFDEPVENLPPSTPISHDLTPPPTKSDPSAKSTSPAADAFVRGIQGAGVGSKSPQKALPPTISNPVMPAHKTPTVGDADNLTDDECRTILQAYFHGGQIFKEKTGGGIELNFGQRWSKTRGTFGRSWVLATESLKLGIKAMEWLSSLEDRSERPAKYVDAAMKRSIEKCIDVAHDRLMMQSTLVKYPLVIYGPIFWREAGIPLDHICARKGDDGFVRFSAQQVSILVLDDDQIGIFVCALDTITGRIGTHKARSYNYKDIVSVADEDTTIEVEMQEGTKKINVYAFNIEVSSGRNLTITLNSQTIRELFDGDALEQPEHQQTVNVIRQMWRTKKSE